MYKKKRGQVTVYIILGIIILFLAILLFYFRGTTEEEMGMQELVRAQKIPKEARPITNYVTTQLDDATKKGLLLIGMQGGYIYESQGGPIPDPIDEGKDFIYDYNDYAVSYGIYRQTQESSYYYFPDPPRYPWDNFPCIFYEDCVGARIMLDLGSFGTKNLPPLNGSNPSNPSIESQLTLYITNYLKENIDLTIFDEQGFDITYEEMNVSIIIGEDDVIAFLEYPLIINKTLTNKITKVSYFYTNPQIRLKKVYKFVEKIIKNDIVDITFDIDNPNNDEDDIWIEKVEDAYKQDDLVVDLIVIRDNRSMLYAEPYTFQFARENRNPALHLIYLPILPKGNVQDYITKEDINPKAYDADEDVLTFTYDPNLPYPVANLGPDSRFYLRVTVDDGVLEDWQDLVILVIGFISQYI
ncbi:MAG: hypothetical protein KKA61_03870 [Nanoarchaeota archaeon]|nr:hypothetical protein [Nanoarchaeota archaeon]